MWKIRINHAYEKKLFPGKSQFRVIKKTHVGTTKRWECLELCENDFSREILNQMRASNSCNQIFFAALLKSVLMFVRFFQKPPNLVKRAECRFWYIFNTKLKFTKTPDCMWRVGKNIYSKTVCHFWGTLFDKLRAIYIKFKEDILCFNNSAVPDSESTCLRSSTLMDMETTTWVAEQEAILV